MTDLRDEPVEIDILDTERVFAGRVWDIRREEFAYNGASIVREYMDHTGAVAVLALDEDDRVLLIKQYRHPVRMRDWEIPAGLLDIEGEVDPDRLVAAARRREEVAQDVPPRRLRRSSGTTKRPTSRCAGLPSTRSSTPCWPGACRTRRS